MVHPGKHNKVKLNVKLFTETLLPLEKAVYEQNYNDYLRDATIYRFKYTYDAAWKAARAIFAYRGLEIRTPREIFTEAFASGWIDQPEVWDTMIEDRNLTSHTYRERTAEAVKAAICENYFPQFKLLLERMMEEVRKIDPIP
jgi:nucleotidyltransferase substrate binding protein (TIGR01987 family)